MIDRMKELSSLLHAFRAKAIELYLMLVYFEPEGFVGLRIEAFSRRDIKVSDGTATLTDEMVVGLHVCIEMIKGASERDPADESLLDEDADIPIHGSHAEVWELLAHFAI